MIKTDSIGCAWCARSPGDSWRVADVISWCKLVLEQSLNHICESTRVEIVQPSVPPANCTEVSGRDSERISGGGGGVGGCWWGRACGAAGKRGMG
jgi:hypothetical protein